ncbi:WD repeat-containing protein 60-like [Lingula anatina]|uniref:WD repeat-containing protein 60-like n=1 Tax=Lingula anatina TaxID=7574 RepID=A0A1S3I0W6_LINAN|nr:WD repeat-containing protein 60-like [Lingula anatina]|eukprot:XP_013391905.2 WD repeat-containing protein 60-like [Lingula anatina]
MDEVLKAMNEENARLLNESRRSDWSSTPDSDENTDSRRADQPVKRPVTSRSRGFINFVSAKQRQISDKAASKARRRGQELLQLIELDVANFSLFDLPPVKEYELYMRNFGSMNTKQAYIQTNEDNIDRDIQTEEIETKEKWCQHPPEDLKGSGGDDEETEKSVDSSGKVDSVRLTKFLQQSLQVVAILLEEDQAERNQAEVLASRSNTSFSESTISLTQPSFLADRPVLQCHFSPVQNNLLLAVHGPPSGGSCMELANKGMISLWNTNEPSRPKQILTCESQPTCCCFSPEKATLAFAGMTDGSLVVWDLREPASMHHVYRTREEEWLLRKPTYFTAGILGEENHHSPVTTVIPIVSAADSAKASVMSAKETDFGTGLSFQLASAEENAWVHLWVVAEISNPDEAGSESDLGLAPGGRVKLLKSSSCKLENPTRDVRLKSSLRAHELALSPANPSNFYVGTDSGYVYHGVRSGGKAVPRTYKGEVDAPVPVTCLDFPPFSHQCFLAGCADGSIRLHNLHLETPLVTWLNSTNGNAVQVIRWSRSRPSVFYVLDAAAKLHVWDLLKDDAAPVNTETFSQDSLCTFSLSSDHSATGMGLPNRKAQMVVSFKRGGMDVHTLSQHLVTQQVGELEEFLKYVDKVL